MRSLLVVTALLEGVTGFALVAIPSQLATLLWGSSLDSPAALTLARVVGVALIAVALTCWLTGVAIVLAYAFDLQCLAVASTALDDVRN